MNPKCVFSQYFLKKTVPWELTNVLVSFKSKHDEFSVQHYLWYLVFIGFGISLNNWISLVFITIVVVIFALMIYLTYLAFALSDKIVKKLGANLITVIGKIMGLILAIMGTGMAVQGIKIAFKI